MPMHIYGRIKQTVCLSTMTLLYLCRVLTVLLKSKMNFQSSNLAQDYKPLQLQSGLAVL